MTTSKPRASIPVLLGLVLCAAAGGFCHTFSSLAAYDDEGLLMMMLRRFFAGEPLYDRVWTIYGPIYYLYEWVARALLGTFSRDSVRFVSLFFWIATAALLYVLILRISGSLLLAAASFAVAFRVLRFIGSEPSHPQEFCVFLLIALAGAAFYAGSRRIRMAMLGALVGLMLMVKINLGIFAGLGLALAWTYAAPVPPLLRRALSAAALLFPIVLLRPHLHELWAQEFCCVVVVSLTAVLLQAAKVRFDFPTAWSDVPWAIAGCAAAAIAGCAFALAHGSTLSGMFRCLVIDPATLFVGFRYWPTRIRLVSLPWAAAALWLAWRSRTQALPARWIALLKIGLGLCSALVCVGNLGNDLIGFGLPFQWLILIAPDRGPTARLSAFARVLLAFVSVLQTLYAYPVAGSQVWVVSIFVLLVGAICIADGWEIGRLSQMRTLAVVTWIALAILFAGNAWWNVRDYRALTPLGLPGSRYLRLPPARVSTLRDLTTAVAANCDTLVTIPSMPSFNLWTGTSEPPELAFADWMMALDDPAQQQLLRRLAAAPRVCAIYNPEETAFWTHGADITEKPLVHHFLKESRLVLARGGYQLLR